MPLHHFFWQNLASKLDLHQHCFQIKLAFSRYGIYCFVQANSCFCSGHILLSLLNKFHKHSQGSQPAGHTNFLEIWGLLGKESINGREKSGGLAIMPNNYSKLVHFYIISQAICFSTLFFEHPHWTHPSVTLRAFICFPTETKIYPFHPL